MDNTYRGLFLTIVVSAYALFGASGCGPEAPTSCEDCLAQQAQNLPPDDGCWPYCEAPPDEDGDGIEDSADACPSEPETRNGFQDADGCPDVVPAPAALSTEIAGTWLGTSVLSVNGGTYSRSHSVPVFVSADRFNGSISGFCPDGSGTVPLLAYTNAPDAAWTGIYSCPPGPWGTCGDGVAIRANMLVFDITVYPTANGVRIVSHGSVTLTDGDDTRSSPCDQTGQFSAEFTGTR
jgi:hypothetical protein